MDQDQVEEANALFSIVENCAKHGGFQHINTAAMERLKEINNELGRPTTAAGAAEPTTRTEMPPEGGQERKI